MKPRRWSGIVPKQHSSGGRNRLGNISEQGDRYLRGLFVAGALAVIRYAKIHYAKIRYAKTVRNLVAAGAQRALVKPVPIKPGV